MKRNTIYLFIILYLLQTTIGWKAILDRHEILYINKNYITLNNASIHKFNRTTKALSVDLEILRDLPLNGMIQIKIFGFLSNQYRELPLVITRKICDFLRLEFQWVKSEVHGHFPDDCPITKDKYYIKDFVLDVRRFPKKPWSINDYKIQFRIYNKKEKLCEYLLYAITTDNDEYSV